MLRIRSCEIPGRSTVQRRRRCGNCIIAGVVLGVLSGTLTPRVVAGASPQSGDETRSWRQAGIEGIPNGDDRERAVRLARQGAFEEALAILRRLLADAPRDLGLRGDLAAVLSWAGRDQEALEVGARLTFVELEPMVAEAVARSARNVGEPGLAVGIYRQTLPRHPDRLESQLGLALAYLEWGEIGEAQLRAALLRERFPDHPDAHVAAGHVYRGVGRTDDALRSYREAVRLDAAHHEAARQTLQMLEARGHLDEALALIRTVPDAFNDDVRARIPAEIGARLVRERDPDALAFLDEALRRLDPDEGGVHRVRLRFDRVQALRDHERMEAVLDEVAALEAEGHELPPYVQRAAGDALRELAWPDEALARYRNAAEAWPDDFESHRAAFHVLVDAGRFEAADSLMREFVDDHPDHVPARVTRATGSALAGRLGRAQAELEALKGMHPSHLEVRRELAAVYRWRGWSRRALAEYEGILRLDPGHEAAHVGRTAALLDLGRRAQARAALDTLESLAPGVAERYGLDGRFRTDGLWEMAVDGDRGNSTGGELGTRDHTLRTRLVSPPVADRIRLRLASYREDARFEEGTGVHDRISAGMELRMRDLRIVVEGSGSRQGERHPGFNAQVAFDPGDRLSLAVSGASYSVEVPLRARPTGVRGWDAGASVGWRAHEGRSWRGRAGVVELTDGNRRLDAYGVLTQSVLRRPGGSVALMLEGYGATHDRDDVPYFSPARLGSASASLAWDWIPWRRGDGRLRQRLVLTGGAAGQSGEDTLPTGAVRLDHDWAASPRFSLRYGGRWASPVYDGDRERRLSGHVGFTWRLP